MWVWCPYVCGCGCRMYVDVVSICMWVWCHMYVGVVSICMWVWCPYVYGCGVHMYVGVDVCTK